MSSQVKGQCLSSFGKCFIIAEAGVNHNGSVEVARELVRAAVAAGADAIKFQTFKADLLVTEDAPKADYQKQTTGDGESQRDMLKKLELSEKAHRELFALCKELGILFLSTPFDEKSADFLHEIGMQYFKMPSGELTNEPLLRHVAAIGKPLIISTGMATLEEVKDAIEVVYSTDNRDVALLHCVSNYPAKFEDVNLRAMQTMAEEFHIPVGYSDHTPGIEASLAAVAMGARIIEKHLTLDKDMPGPDHQASLNALEFGEMVKGIRRVEAAMGHGRKEPAASEKEIAYVARRSWTAKDDIFKGEILTQDKLVLRRPGSGIPSSKISLIVGKRVQKNISQGTQIREEDLGAA